MRKPNHRAICVARPFATAATSETLAAGAAATTAATATAIRARYRVNSATRISAAVCIPGSFLFARFFYEFSVFCRSRGVTSFLSTGIITAFFLLLKHFWEENGCAHAGSRAYEKSEIIFFPIKQLSFCNLKNSPRNLPCYVFIFILFCQSLLNFQKYNVICPLNCVYSSFLVPFMTGFGCYIGAQRSGLIQFSRHALSTKNKAMFPQVVTICRINPPTLQFLFTFPVAHLWNVNFQTLLNKAGIILMVSK